MDKLKMFVLALICTFAVSKPIAVSGSEADEVTIPTETAVQAAVEARVEEKESVVQEASAAITHSYEALKALEEGHTDDALEALTLSVGKLEMVVTRNPEMALAPISVNVSSIDVAGRVGTVEALISDAKKSLEEGNVQKARHLLKSLGSEVVISTTSVPLASYPLAIKHVVPLIDDGKVEEAKTRLEAALSTLVVVEEVVPLPVLRAQSMVTLAAALADQPERTDEQSQLMTKSVDAAREQLELAQLLGYGDRDRYTEIWKQLGELERKLGDEEAASNFFTRLRESIASLLPA